MPKLVLDKPHLVLDEPKKPRLVLDDESWMEPSEEDKEKYRKMGVEKYRSPSGKLYDLTAKKGFQDWYAGHAAKLGLNPNPEDPRHYYDYRAAYEAGEEPDETGHWPSKYKRPGHPRTIVDGMNTITGEPEFPAPPGNFRGAFEGEVLSGKLADIAKERGIAHKKYDPIADAIVRGTKRVYEDIGIVSQMAQEMISPTTEYTREESEAASGELYDQLSWWKTYLGSLGGRIGPKGLRPELLKEAEEFHGFGPALMPIAGKTGTLAIEWGVIYPALFKAAGFTNTAIMNIPKVKAGTALVKKFGGFNKLAQRFPRAYAVTRNALNAFLKGGEVGTVTSLAETVGKEPIGTILKTAGKRAALVGGTAVAFQLTSELDTALYIRDFRANLLKASNQRFGTEIANIKATIPKGPQQTSAIQGLQSAKTRELRAIDSIVSGAEAQLRGIKEGKLYQQGQEAVETPQQAAKRFIARGFTSQRGYGAGESVLKKGLGKTEPFIKMPTTRAGEVREAVGEAAKAIRHPIKTVQRAARPTTKELRMPPKPVTPPPVPTTEIETRQAEEIGEMDRELAAIQATPEAPTVAEMPRRAKVEEKPAPIPPKAQPYPEISPKDRRRQLVRDAKAAKEKAALEGEKKKLKVMRQVRDEDGNELGVLVADFDGTPEDAISKAKILTKQMWDEYPDASNIQSQIGATDTEGNAKYVISQNFRIVEDLAPAVEGKVAYKSPETKEIEALVEEAKHKSIDEFKKFLWSGHSLADVQDRFRAITGESRFSGKTSTKLGIKGETVGVEPARSPTDQEIEDFYNKARIQPPAPQAPAKLTKAEFDTERKRILNLNKKNWEMMRREARIVNPTLAISSDLTEAHHKLDVQHAVSEGKPVPRAVLEEYKSEQWAQEALAKPKKKKPTAPAKRVKVPEVEKTEEELTGMSQQRRMKLLGETRRRIREHPAYKEFETVFEDNLQALLGNVGAIYVEPTLWADLEDVVGTDRRTKLARIFTKDKGSSKGWDELTEYIADELGNEEARGWDLYTLVSHIKDALETTTKKGAFKPEVIAEIESDPDMQLALMKEEMLNAGDTVDQIDEAIVDWAEHYGVAEEVIFDEFIGPEAKKLRDIKVMKGEEQERALEALARDNVLRRERTEALQATKEVLRANKIEDVPVKEVAEITEDDIPFERVEGRPTGATVTLGERQIVLLAYGADSETGYHEGYHILRSRLTPKDLKFLNNKFKDEEAEAREFARYVKTGKTDPLYRVIWRKLLNILRKIKSSLQGRGYRTVEDIFGEIEAGKVAKVEPSGARAAFEKLNWQQSKIKDYLGTVDYLKKGRVNGFLHSDGTFSDIELSEHLTHAGTVKEIGVNMEDYLGDGGIRVANQGYYLALELWNVPTPSQVAAIERQLIKGELKYKEIFIDYNTRKKGKKSAVLEVEEGKERIAAQKVKNIMLNADVKYERGVFGQPIQKQLWLPLAQRQANIRKIQAQEKYAKAKEGEVGVSKEATKGIEKIRKLDVKQRVLEQSADDILRTSGVGQAPPIFHRELNKAIEIQKQKAEIWNSIRGSIVTPSGKTLWQLAIEKHPVKRFGKETALPIYAKDIDGLIAQPPAPKKAREIKAREVKAKDVKPYEHWGRMGRPPIKSVLVKAVDAEIARTMKPRSNAVKITPEQMVSKLRNADLYYDPRNPLPEIREAFTQLVKGGPLFKLETSADRLRREAIRNAQVRAEKERLKKRVTPKVSRSRLKIKIHDTTPMLSSEMGRQPGGRRMPIGKEPRVKVGKELTEPFEGMEMAGVPLPPEKMVFYTERPMRRTEAPPNQQVPQEVYDRNRDRSPAKEKIHDIGQVIKSAARESDNYVTSASRYVGQISDEIRIGIREHARTVNKRTQMHLREVEPFIKAVKKMEKGDRKDLDLALKNGDVGMAGAIVEKYNLREEYAAVRDVDEAIYEGGNEVGMGIAHRLAHWHRRVKDRNGLLNALIKRYGKSNILPAYQAALARRKEQAGGRELTEYEKTQVINSMMRGFGRRIWLARPAGAKERSLWMIDEELNKFYYSAVDSMLIYIREMNRAIADREFFGRRTNQIKRLQTQRSSLMTRLYKLSTRIGRRKPVTEGKHTEHISKARKRFEEIEKQLAELQTQGTEDIIGTHIADLVVSGDITPEQQDDLQRGLLAYFNYKPTSTAIRAAKSVAYMTTIGSPFATLTQLKDYGRIMYRAPGRGITVSMKRLVPGAKMEYSMQDLWMSDIAVDISGMSRMLDGVLTVTQFKRVDRLMKEVYVSAVIEKYRAQAQKPRHLKEGSVFRDRIERAVGKKKADRVIKDLAAGKKTDLTDQLAWSELLDMHPVALSEMSINYLEGGGGTRMLYTLRTFGVKQMEYARREIFDEMGKNKPRAIARLIWLAFTLAIAGAGVESLKQLLRGRKPKFEDEVVDEWLSLIFMSRYSAGVMRRKGPGRGLLETMLPPTKIIDAPARDIVKGEFKETKKLVPVIGENWYWSTEGEKPKKPIWED